MNDDASEIREDERGSAQLVERRVEIGRGEGVQLARGRDDPRVPFCSMATRASLAER